MANYYVSAARGSDSTGTGTAANPWQTINKAIGPSPAITLSGSGDTLYIEPGIYRETVALGLSPTAAGPLAIVGDGDGAGFSAGGYPSPVTGVVEIRAWSDGVTPMTTSEILSATGKSYVAVRGLKLIAGNGTGTYSCFNLSGAFSDWSFEDCNFVGSTTRGFIGAVNATAGAALNTTFRRCIFTSVASNSTYYGVDVRCPLNATEYDVSVLFQNCSFFGSAGCIRHYQNGGSGSAWATGLRVQHCGFYYAYRGVYVGSSPALTTPIGVYGCTFAFTATGVQATTSGQIAEDGNIYVCGNNTTNVAPGAHSIAVGCPAFSFHDERLFGGQLRPFLEPSAVSPALGAGGYGTPPSVDLWNRGRPEGGGSPSPSCGPIERHDTGVKNVTYQDAGSPACLALIGPSSQDRPILVNAQTTTIRVKVRWDGNHGDASKPQATLLANPEIGVAAQTVTASSTGGSGATPNAYETLSFAPITPTADGVVMLRMTSRAASGAGAAYFDTITLS